MLQVKIYSTPTCTYCKHAKEFFDEKDISYEDYNVSADTEKRTEMIEMTGQMGVPVILIEGKDPVIGFNREKIAEMLGIQA